jgi:hypothetical protein
MSDQPQTNAYEIVLADLKAKREQEIKTITDKYDPAIAALEILLNGGAINRIESPAVEGAEVQIKIGEFHGMPTTSATKVILQRANRPLRTDDIVRHIEKSGRKLEAANPAGNIYSSLKRNPDFELVAPNTWGLAEWYPNRSRKSKSAPSVAAKTEEIMQHGTVSFIEATQQAERELATEQKGIPLNRSAKGDE